MKAAIIMGSKSDYPVVEKAEDILKEFGVDYELRVLSAHRTPRQAEEFARKAIELLPGSPEVKQTLSDALKKAP